MPRTIGWVLGIALASVWADRIGAPRESSGAEPMPRIASALPARTGFEAVRTDTYAAFLGQEPGTLICRTAPGPRGIEIEDRFEPDRPGAAPIYARHLCRNDGMLTPIESGIAREGMVTLPIALRLIPSLPKRTGAVFSIESWSDPFDTPEPGDHPVRPGAVALVRSLGENENGDRLLSLESLAGDWRFRVRGSRVMEAERLDGSAHLKLASQESEATPEGDQSQPGNQSARK